MDGSNLVFIVVPTVIPAGPGHRDRAAVRRGQRYRPGVLVSPAIGPDTARSGIPGQLGSRSDPTGWSTSPDICGP